MVSYELSEILEEMKRLAPWYHKIDLGNDLVTPGVDFENVWSNIREVRQLLDYKGKTVLDIASWDGMWAFEAERLGASMVVATETCYKKQENFLFCRNLLKSNVIPFYNISSYNLSDRLDVCFAPSGGTGTDFPGFDIVQHLGLLYHLSDPVLSLMEARSLTREGGVLLLESACIVTDAPVMLFQGVAKNAGRIYPEDRSTWWAPSVTCLKEMLAACFFEPMVDTIQVKPGVGPVARVCMAAKALPCDGENKSWQLLDMGRTWKSRGPGQIRIGGEGS